MKLGALQAERERVFASMEEARNQLQIIESQIALTTIKRDRLNKHIEGLKTASEKGKQKLEPLRAKYDELTVQVATFKE